MNDNNKPSIDMEKILYSVVGGVICLNFMPGYIPYVVAYSGLIGSLLGIGKILEKYKDAEQMNFVSKENIKYFSDKGVKNETIKETIK